MMQSFFNSLSGMMGFSKGLDQVSNNISNMNTAGFRGKDVFYQSVVGDAGSNVSEYVLRTADGDIKQTSTDTNVAISGNGYFVLRDGGNSYLTRGGSFEFNSSGKLVETATGYTVSGIDEKGDLFDFDISNVLVLAPEATKTVELTGNISSDGTNHNISDVNIYSADGVKKTVKVQFTDRTSVTKEQTNSAGVKETVGTGEYEWTVNILASDESVLTTSKVRFDNSGKIVAGYEKLSISYANGTNSASTKFDLNCSALTQYASGSTSSASVKTSDGHAALGISTVAFDDDGILTITYSNGEKVASHQLAVAEVSSMDALVQKNGALFIVRDSDAVTYSRAQERSNGEIVGGSIELANVDLAEEFAEMMIIQRGYQASSRVMNISNEMIETLYGSTR